MRIAVELPARPRERPVAELVAAERELGRELVEEGTIAAHLARARHAAQRRHVEAADATELHELLMSLPTRPWFRTSVEALALHPLEAPDA